MSVSNDVYCAKNMTASTLVKVGPGAIGGIFVSSASGSPSIAIYDTAAADTSGVMVNTFTPVAATFYNLRLTYANGLRVVIGGTVDCCVSWV